jgi:ABC-type nitrate/sulfonate/bicarbonate transport system substrate-binding protein
VGFDVSAAGKTWIDEIRQFLEHGNEQWERAFSNLSYAIAKWKENADSAVKEGEKTWREAYQKIEAARDAWRERIQREIDGGIENWRQSENELTVRIEDSRFLMNEYLSLQREQWAEYSQQLARLADEGFRSVIQSQSSLSYYTEQARLPHCRIL